MRPDGCPAYNHTEVGETLEHSTLRIRRTPSLEGQSRPSDAEDAQLVVLVGHASGRRYVVGSEIELGRGSGSPIELLDDGVSRRHARVSRSGSGYMIEDLGSRNGTFVNGERIEQSELNFGDKIAVGSRTVLLFANRDRFEDQRIQAQKLQALGQLSGGIAHDFNNLLGVVLANTTHLQGLQKQHAVEEAGLRAALDDIETAARRAVDLTRQLLAFARSGQRRHETVDLASIVADAERLLRRTLHRSIRLHTKVETDIAVVGDPSQLLQVLMNLCINAGDALPRGGALDIEVFRASYPDVDLGGTDLLSNGDVAVLRVVDDGVGMDAAVRARAFEPFFTTKPRGKGTGLGLATVHAIVRDHGGHVRLDSAVGQGTSFEVLLPCGANQPDVDPRNTSRTGINLHGVVLLADDEVLVRTATRRVLEHAGLEVLEAEDGAQAVDLYSSNADRVDLVILDLDMPNMDGEQAFQRLHALAPKLPVLISSGYIDGDREHTLRRAGVDGLLHKPYDSSALLRAVRAARSKGALANDAGRTTAEDAPDST
jgi:signal transduction histidine kinase/CheY-like chemotaxis protein